MFLTAAVAPFCCKFNRNPQTARPPNPSAKTRRARFPNRAGNGGQTARRRPSIPLCRRCGRVRESIFRNCVFATPPPRGTAKLPPPSVFAGFARAKTPPPAAAPKAANTAPIRQKRRFGQFCASVNIARLRKTNRRALIKTAARRIPKHANWATFCIRFGGKTAAPTKNRGCRAECKFARRHAPAPPIRRGRRRHNRHFHRRRAMRQKHRPINTLLPRPARRRLTFPKNSANARVARRTNANRRQTGAPVMRRFLPPRIQSPHLAPAHLCGRSDRRF